MDYIISMVSGVAAGLFVAIISEKLGAKIVIGGALTSCASVTILTYRLFHP